ncbi:MarR family winged helix-turn-helix transcriptional regulator [Bacillus marasmi]|uniref:MarR family winged helix-turn-helix transcriptional regulator n=1 Tax=Bacillus marasmi TaxID=1926279 RepID=UPI0011C77202|nr:MarR family transcriptional regulator [Bacillus marasmi]
MEQDGLDLISMELAVLIRGVTYISTKQKLGNLDRSGFLLLHQISTHGSVGVKTLANEFHLDISTVSRQASALEKKGYLTRKPDPYDGRAYTLHITELGAKEFNLYKNNRLNAIREVLEEWSEEERVAFGKYLRKFNQSLISKDYP